jgi:hypothetical protein
MNRRALLSSLAVVAALVVAVSCGGGSSPSSASGSGTGSVGIQGVVLSSAAATGAPGAELTASAGVKASGGTITVTVDGTGITTTVSANGTFELKGVPSGEITLVFKKDGVEIGRVTITVADGAEVKITIQVQTTGQTTTIIVVEIKIDEKDGGDTTTTTKTCLISGGTVGSGIELEGNVSSGNATSFKMAVNGERSSGLVDVSAASASYKCNGGAKLSDSDCKLSLQIGSKVHVRGTLMTCDLTTAKVTATEVMIQK